MICTHYSHYDILILKVGDLTSVSESQQRAVNKYLRNTYDDIKIRVPKGKRQIYRKAAKEAGYNFFNQFVIDAIEKKISDTKPE